MPIGLVVLIFGWIGYCMWLFNKYDIMGLYGGMVVGIILGGSVNFISSFVWEDFLENDPFTEGELFLVYIASGGLLYFFIKKYFSSTQES